MTLKVWMTPTAEALGPGGISTVVKAYKKYLPQMGVKFVETKEVADISVSHAGTYPGADVVHCHGLHWTYDFPEAPAWENHTNRYVITAIRRAHEVVVPSKWVAITLERDMRFSPYIIGHGIDANEWLHKYEKKDYVLWNKNRTLDVCDNSILVDLCEAFPHIQFVSTYPTDDKLGPIPPNLLVTGTLEHEQMKRVIQKASVYLSSTKETFGIGVLEAMASGSVVLAVNQGGNKQILEHKETGYLYRPTTNHEDLFEGLTYCLDKVNQEYIIPKAQKEITSVEYSWPEQCEKVLEVWERAFEKKKHTFQVSVVIPVYNKPKELVDRAIQSMLSQTLSPNEIIVVLDGPCPYDIDIDDDAGLVKVIKQENKGVAHARNIGIMHSNSDYISCLDADDWVEEDFLMACATPFNQENSLGLGISFTGLKTHFPDGTSGQSEWPSDFNYDFQIQKHNQIPTCCVFRKEAWARIGGYKQRYGPDGAGSEDAAFWTVFGAISYDAIQATKRPLFNYSMGIGATSKSDYQEIDWLALYPWVHDDIHPFASLAQPKNNIAHPVHQYDEPLISVIIPIGPGHETQFEDALDSLESQSFRDWEAIVVWDSPDGFGISASTKTDIHVQVDPEVARLVRAYPYVNWEFTSGGKGAGYARNRGVEVAKAPFILFLDADDILTSTNALTKMFNAWREHKQIIYSDYLGRATGELKDFQKAFKERVLNYNEKSGRAIIKYSAADFDCEKALAQPKLDKTSPNMPYYLWTAISILIPKKWHDSINGFDAEMDTWEDVDYMWRLARKGYCFHRIVEPLFLYDFDAGFRRQQAIPTRDDIGSQERHKARINYMRAKYEKEGAAVGCNCGQAPANKVILNGKGVMQSMAHKDELVLIEFWPVGKVKGAPYGAFLKSATGQTINGNVIEYGGYSRKAGDQFLVHPADQAVNPKQFKLVKCRMKMILM